MSLLPVVLSPPPIVLGDSMFIVVPRSMEMRRSRIQQHSHPGKRGHHPLEQVAKSVTPKMGPQKRTNFGQHENVTQRAATTLC
jgi:hypothetical protein